MELRKIFSSHSTNTITISSAMCWVTVIDFMIVEELLHCQHLADYHIVLGAGDFGVGQLNYQRPMPIFGLSRPGNRRWRCCSWCPSTHHCQSCNSRLDYLLLLAYVHCPRHIKTVPRHFSGGAVLVITTSEIEYLTVKTVHHSDIWHPLLGLGQNVFQLS